VRPKVQFAATREGSSLLSGAPGAAVRVVLRTTIPACSRRSGLSRGVHASAARLDHRVER
jgi:hypothetical protein